MLLVSFNMPGKTQAQAMTAVLNFLKSVDLAFTSGGKTPTIVPMLGTDIAIGDWAVDGDLVSPGGQWPYRPRTMVGVLIDIRFVGAAEVRALEVIAGLGPQTPTKKQNPHNKTSEKYPEAVPIDVKELPSGLCILQAEPVFRKHRFA
jgi:hypothetical protein